MLKSKKNILIVLLSLVCLALIIFTATDEARDKRQNDEMRSELSDSLDYFQKLSLATNALFEDDLHSAAFLFEQAEKLLPNGKFRDKQHSHNFIMSILQDRDTLFMLDTLRTALAYKLQQAYYVNTALLDSVAKEKNTLDSVLNLLQQTRDESNQTRAILTETRRKNDSLASYAQDLKSTFGEIEFINPKNIKILYIGYLKDGKAHGHGMGVYETGSFYNGEWFENKRHGHGKFQWANSDVYVGHFEMEERSGQGTYYFKSGEKYVGNWKLGLKNGYGEYFGADGKLLVKGQWKDDKLQKQPGEVGLEW